MGAWTEGWRPRALAFAISLAHFASFDPLRMPVLTDIRYFLYFAWRIASGETPYTDLFDPKAPLASLLGALLWATGEALGLEPLHVVRAGYLLLAAAGGWLAFEVLCALGGGVVAGFLGLAAYCSFGLLGTLPAIGNVPKLVMAVAAPAAALLCLRERWLLAGAAAALAFLDWQIGALVGLGVLVAALWEPAPGRLARALRAVVGGALGAAPALLFLAARGALDDAFEQTVVSAFFRGATSGEAQADGAHLARVGSALSTSLGPQVGLALLSLLGGGAVLLRLRRHARDRLARLLWPLVVYHFGLLAFSAVDFQARGDAFALLHTLAFFLGVAWLALHDAVRRWQPELDPRWLAAGALVLAFAAARPGPLRPQTQWDERMPTLSEQREVAAQLEALLDGRELAAVESSELLVLLRRRNPLPFIYWNAASWATYCPDMDPHECLRRRLDATGTDVRLLWPPPRSGQPRRFERYGLSGRWAPRPPWRAVELASASGRYRIVVHERPRADAGSGAPAPRANPPPAS